MRNSRAVLLPFFAVLLSAPALAQVNNGPTVPASPSRGDVSEVEEVVPDSEYLSEGSDAGDDANEEIRLLQDDELSYSSEEMRGRHDYALSLALGSAKPWTAFSIDASNITRPDLEIGLWAGGGKFSASGILEEKAYNMSVSSRSAGISARWHMLRLETLSFEAVLGYAAWEGRVSPHGANTEEDAETDGAAKLSASYRAHGPVFGISAGLTWLWPSGFFVEWTPIGLRVSRMAQKDVTGGTSAIVGRAMHDNIERPGFYGLTNIEVGYQF